MALWCGGCLSIPPWVRKDTNPVIATTPPSAPVISKEDLKSAMESLSGKIQKEISTKIQPLEKFIQEKAGEIEKRRAEAEAEIKRQAQEEAKRLAEELKKAQKALEMQQAMNAVRGLFRTAQRIQLTEIEFVRELSIIHGRLWTDDHRDWRAYGFADPGYQKRNLARRALWERWVLYYQLLRASEASGIRPEIIPPPPPSSIVIPVQGSQMFTGSWVDRSWSPKKK